MQDSLCVHSFNYYRQKAHILEVISNKPIEYSYLTIQFVFTKDKTTFIKYINFYFTIRV